MTAGLVVDDILGEQFMYSRKLSTCFDSEEILEYVIEMKLLEKC